MYDYPLYRPPSEGNSIIIQATLGCSHNKCSFCNMYKSKKFTIKPLEDIKNDINYFRQIYAHVEKIFLADGDALIIPTEDLKEILVHIKNVFPECSMTPDYLGVLTLMVEEETALYNKILNKEFKLLNDKEILNEIKLLIQHIDVKEPVVFRCNHASNYISLSGSLPKDKEALLNQINYYQDKNKLKKEEERKL